MHNISLLSQRATELAEHSYNQFGNLIISGGFFSTNSPKKYSQQLTHAFQI
jgi:hypothetical protein